MEVIIFLALNWAEASQTKILALIDGPAYAAPHHAVKTEFNCAHEHLESA
jgi:hypothetical protein